MAATTADMTANIAKANVALGGFGKKIQMTTLYTKALNKIFGPFFDLFVKGKQYVELADEVFGEFGETMEDVGESVEVALGPIAFFLKILKGIILILVIGMGIILAFVAVLYMMTGSMGGLGELLPDVTDDFDSIWDSIVSVKDSMMEIIGVVMGLDFSPITGPLMAMLLGYIDILAGFYAMLFDIFAVIFENLAKVFTTLEESGALQSLIDGIGDFMESIMWAFGFISGSLSDVGVTFDSVGTAIGDVITWVVDLMLDSGFIDFLIEIMLLIWEIAALVIKVAAVVIGVVIRIVGFILPYILPYYKAVFAALALIFTFAMGIIRTIVAVVRAIVALFSGDFEKFGEIISGIGDIWSDTFDTMWGYIEDWISAVLDLFSPLIDAISWVAEGVGGIIGGAGDLLSFQGGGIARGPKSGHMAMLHGTEAVVPLPDGSSIPVTLKGIGGGGQTTNFTANITVTGGGNAREIAQAVNEQVQRAFRTRSRSGGYGRGVI